MTTESVRQLWQDPVYRERQLRDRRRRRRRWKCRWCGQPFWSPTTRVTCSAACAAKQWKSTRWPAHQQPQAHQEQQP